MTLNLSERMNLLHFWAKMPKTEFREFVVEFKPGGKPGMSKPGKRMLFDETKKSTAKNQVFLRAVLKAIADSRPNKCVFNEDLLSDHVAVFIPALNTPVEEIYPELPDIYRSFTDWVNDSHNARVGDVIVSVHENMRLDEAQKLNFMSNFAGNYDVYRVLEGMGAFPCVARETLRIELVGDNRITATYFSEAKNTFVGGILISDDTLLIKMQNPNPQMNDYRSISLFVCSEPLNTGQKPDHYAGKLVYTGIPHEIHSYRVVLKKNEKADGSSVGPLSIGSEVFAYYPSIRNDLAQVREKDSSFALTRTWATEALIHGIAYSQKFNRHSDQLDFSEYADVEEAFKELDQI